MTAAERAVGAEATRYALKSCRVCNGKGVMRIWVTTKLKDMEPGECTQYGCALAGGEWHQHKSKMLEPTICGCAISRFMKKKADEIEEVSDPDNPKAPKLLCWKIGFTPKEKQKRILEQEAAKHGDGLRTDSDGSGRDAGTNNDATAIGGDL